MRTDRVLTEYCTVLRGSAGGLKEQGKRLHSTAFFIQCWRQYARCSAVRFGEAQRHVLPVAMLLCVETSCSVLQHVVAGLFCESLRALLFPFQWHYTYIPVLPLETAMCARNSIMLIASPRSAPRLRHA
jgi:hypothetical protein